MTSREITSVAIRVVIVYIIFQVIIGLPWAYISWYSYHEKQFLPFILILLILAAAITAIIFLWKYTQKLVEKNIATESEDIVIHITAVKLEKMLLRCLGMYFIIGKLNPLVFHVFMALSEKNKYDNADIKLKILVDATIICFSCFLIVTPGKWLVAIHRLRKQ